jgi:cell division protein FtsI (penicillin-binding protein 3)
MIKAIFYKNSILSTKTSDFDSNTWRHVLIALFFILFTSLLVSRLVRLHIFHTDFLRAQGNARTLRVVDIPSYRGMITDRRGTPIAISTPVHAVWANPQHFTPTAKERRQLAILLGTTPENLTQRISQNAHRVFIYLKRGITPDIAQKIQALNLPGIGLKREFRRYYPSARQTAQLVGFTDIDDHGQAGLELTYEEILKPTVGKKRVLEDRTGQWVQDVDHLRTPRSGRDMALSIDARIQGFAFRELEKALKQYKAKAATLVMLDVRTGEVLAMVSAPSFNPNNRLECHGSATRNRALTDPLEPGSTIKAFSLASALASRTFSPDSLIDTHPGTLNVGHHLVKDLHNYGTLSLKDILTKSSNVGITKITLALPAEQLVETFRKLGLGDSINTPFAGERRGSLPLPPKNPFAHATLSFGYGLTVTPLQLARAYAILANHGIERPTSLIKIEEDPTLVAGQQVLPADIARATLDMLTGSRVSIPGYKTAGKTGTTRVVGPHGYDPNRHIGLFAGITPVDNPRLATVVIVEEPDEANYYGIQVAAPIYKNVVSKALYILNIPPDNTAPNA